MVGVPLEYRAGSMVSAEALHDMPYDVPSAF